MGDTDDEIVRIKESALNDLIEEKAKERLQNRNDDTKDTATKGFHSISRRQFLKYTGLGISGITLPSLVSAQSIIQPQEDGVSEIDAFSVNGHRLWVQSDEPSGPDPNDLWYLTENNSVQGWVYTGHSEIVAVVAVGPNGDYVYSGSYDEEVHQINVSDGSQGWTYSRNSVFDLEDVAVGPNGNYVYCCSSDDNDVHQISVSDGSGGWVYTGHSTSVEDIAVGTNGDYVYSGSQNSENEVHQISSINEGSMVYWDGSNWRG